MARSLGTLTLSLIADLGGYTSGLTKAEHEAQKRGKAIQQSLQGAVSFFAGTASVAAFTTFIKNATDSLDQLNDVADATGSSVEKISALEDVARRTGGTIDTVESSLIRFNAQLSASDGKNETSRALKQIGVDAEELKRLDPADALKKTADALAKYADDGDKARIVQVLFGKSVREVAPFLKDLASAGRFQASRASQSIASKPSASSNSAPRLPPIKPWRPPGSQTPRSCASTVSTRCSRRRAT